MRMEIDRLERDDSELLGPGKRVELWLHGCQKNCRGCIARQHNSAAAPMLSLSTRAVLDYVLKDSKTEGITISGGEPFLQGEALLELVKMLHQKNRGIILYSGYTYEELLSGSLEREILKYTDVLIDGPYIEELDDGKPYRGSSNQRIHHLTERYRSFYEDSMRKRECRIEQKGIYFTLTGIPDSQSKEIWKWVKHGDGAEWEN